jgi:IS30 family transposase
MANRLSMATIHSVETLHRSGHSRREIARLLGIDRGTVNAYIRRLQAGSGDEGAGSTEANPQPSADQNQPHPQTGSVQNRPNPQTGSNPESDEKQRQLTHHPETLADFNPRTSGRF